MKKMKKFGLAFVLLLAIILFTGCQGNVNVYRYYDDDYNYEDIEIEIPVSLLPLLEYGATDRPSGGQWTFLSYITDCAEYITNAMGLSGTGLGYKFYDRFQNEDSNYSYYVIGKFKKEEQDGKKVSFLSGEIDYENLFIGVATFGCKNLLDGAYGQLNSGTTGHKAIEAVNGFGSFPSIYEAFPALLKNNYDIAALPVTQYVNSNRKSKSADGESAVICIVYGIDEGASTYFVPYEGTLGGTGAKSLEYKTKYYVSVGWFLVAASCGVLTVFILFLLLTIRKRKKQAAGEIEAEIVETPLSEDGLVENQKVDVPNNFANTAAFYGRYGGYPNQGGHPNQGTYGGYQNQSGAGYNPYQGQYNRPSYPQAKNIDPFEEFSKPAGQTDKGDVSNNYPINNGTTITDEANHTDKTTNNDEDTKPQ